MSFAFALALSINNKKGFRSHTHLTHSQSSRLLTSSLRDEVKTRLIDENFLKLKGKSEGSRLLEYTGLCGGLEHLKIETRLRGVVCECDG